MAGALATTLAAAIGRAVAPVITAIGTTAAVVRPTLTTQPDKSVRRTWTAVTGLEAVPMLVEEITAERAAREWGAELVVHAVATLVIAAADVRQDDGLTVSGGPFAGQRYTIARIQPDTVGATQRLALQSFRAGFTP